MDEIIKEFERIIADFPIDEGPFGEAGEFTAEDIKVKLTGLLDFMKEIDAEPQHLYYQDFNQVEINNLKLVLQNIASHDSLAGYIQGLVRGKTVLREISYLINIPSVDASNKLFNKLSKTIDLKTQEINNQVSSVNQASADALINIDKVAINTNNLNKQYEQEKSNFEEILKGILEGATKSKADINNLLGETSEGRSRISEVLEETNRQGSAINKILEGSTVLYEDIEQSKKDSESKLKVIAGLEERTETINHHLESQTEASDNFKQVLTDHTDASKEHLENLIDVVKDANAQLAEGTAIGLSKAFNARVEKDQSAMSRRIQFGWLSVALSGTIAAIFLGYATSLFTDLTSNESFNLTHLIAKFGITFIPLTVSWFCARQYSKNRIIAEDYFYKSVLTQSLVGFLDQFEDEGERTEYLKTLFGQLFQDPLRNKHDSVSPVENVLGGFFSKKGKNENEQDSQ